MRRNLLAAGAAAFVLACPGAFAATSASNGQFTVTTDPMGLFDGVTITGGVVSATSGFAGAGSAVIPMQVSSDFLLTFEAAPGYEIDGYTVDLEVSGGAATYTGPSYGSVWPAYASFSSTYGSAYYTTPDQTDKFTATLSAGPVGGYMSFYAWPSSFCVVPLEVCYDLPPDVVVLPAGVYLDYFHVTPIIEAIAAPVDEPASAVLVALGLVGMGLRRRPLRVSVRRTGGSDGSALCTSRSRGA